MKIVIIGGVAGGMSAATRLRRLNADADIVVFERSGFVSYANCGLPYYVGGVIDDENELILQTPASLEKRFRLDVRIKHEVTAIDADAKTVTVRNLLTDEDFTTAYDYLVLSPGATPVVPPIPGIERAHPLRTVEDVERLKAIVDARPRSAVVIGGGFIGVEIAENLRHQNVPVTLVEALDQVLAPLDPEMAVDVATELRTHGVDLRLGTSVIGVTHDAVELSDGEVVPGELVVVAIGVRPDTSLARVAGLDIGPRGGVRVDEFQRTSNPSIYAIGDVVEKVDALDETASLVPLANVANRQGRIVADHISGRPVRVVPVIGTAIVKVFDLTIASTGWNEKRLRAAGLEYVAIHTHPASHAGYYPGAQTMHLKLLVDPISHRILGAQGVGPEGVDKRIDVLATALRAGLTAPELSSLELAYAPPFGSAKDPINMLGYVAENVLSGLEPTVQWDEVLSAQADGALVVDVRTPGEFERGHIPGSINIPVDDVRDRVGELIGERVIVTCQVGIRGHIATMFLREKGVDAKNLDGGFSTWHHSPHAELNVVS